MTDIIRIEDGEDLGVQDTQAPRAANILSVQVQSLEYAQDLGIDLRYFLKADFTFQNESFRSYLVEVLANNGINVSSISETVNSLYQQLSFSLSAEDQGDGFVR